MRDVRTDGRWRGTCEQTRERRRWSRYVRSRRTTRTPMIGDVMPRLALLSPRGTHLRSRKAARSFPLVDWLPANRMLTQKENRADGDFRAIIRRYADDVRRCRRGAIGFYCRAVTAAAINCNFRMPTDERDKSKYQLHRDVEPRSFVEQWWSARNDFSALKETVSAEINSTTEFTWTQNHFISIYFPREQTSVKGNCCSLNYLYVITCVYLAVKIIHLRSIEN